MRLGIFGGTFDPVHYGHLLLAEYCRTERSLDQVLFMPAARNPHKQGQTSTAAQQRAEMLGLAIAGHTPFEVSRLEIDRGGVSYTADTLRAVHDEDTTRELFLLIGADTLADLPNWKDPAEICRLAIPVVVARAGADEPDLDCLSPFVTAERLEEFRRHRVVDMPRIELSSSEIRRRVAAGLSIRFQTPRAVEKYIETEGLYRDV